MNGGEVILADEPTGALDSKSGADLMALLRELHDDGHMIIIVTHDHDVASQADRIVEISDGRIISDTRTDPTELRPPRARDTAKRASKLREGFDRGAEALRMALRAMISHKLRTFLTMLGIIIGIASVVSVVALGQGSQQAVLERISAIGTNTINVIPGTGFGDRRAARIRTLVPSDADAIASQPYADSVSPRVTANATAVYKNLSASAQVTGVGADYFRVNGSAFDSGVGFSAQGVASRSQEAVIDTNAQSALFPNENPLGQVIMLGRVPVRVIGVIEADAGFGPRSDSANVYLPYTTAMDRMLGRNYLSGITVRIADDYDMADAEAGITELLTRLHGTEDFFLQNTNTIRDTIESTSQTLTLLVSAIS
jgi:macrolide transport system ATP-binding/permease protein